MRLQPYFISSADAHLFCLYDAPDTPSRAALIIPPFAEEMNKSRHMLRRLGTQLKAAGCASLLFDFYGTGDSEGTFGDATPDQWRQNLQDAANTLRERSGHTQIDIVALRAGALFATHWLTITPDSVGKLVLWQPVIRGDQLMTQFLRLKMAADMMRDQSEKMTTEHLREILQTQGSLEVAGYRLSCALHDAIAAMQLTNVTPAVPVYWFELSGQSNKPITPASSKLIAQWQSQGVPIQAASAIGDAFWATQEIAASDDLLQQTTTVVCADVA